MKIIVTGVTSNCLAKEISIRLKKLNHLVLELNTADEVRNNLPNTDSIFHLYQHANLQSTIEMINMASSVGVKDFIIRTPITALFRNFTKVLITENYGPLTPPNNHSATFLSVEAFLSSYSDSIRPFIFRTAELLNSEHPFPENILNEMKLHKKYQSHRDAFSYLPYISTQDAADAMIYCWTNMSNKVNVVNIGPTDNSTTLDHNIVQWCSKETGVEDVSYKNFMIGYDMRCTELKKLLYEVPNSSDEAIKKAIKKWTPSE